MASDTVEYGGDAYYTGSTPIKPNDGRTKYVFKGWNRSYSSIVENIDIVAEYDIYNVYTFTFANGASQNVDVIQGDSVENISRKTQLKTQKHI